MRTAETIEFYRSIPKIELHRHLEGSIRLDTLKDVARAHGLLGTGELPALVQVNEQEPYTHQNFLSKFDTLRLFYRSPAIIGRITREAIADAVADNIRYMELRFTPVALSRVEGFALQEVVNWVTESVHDAQQGSNIKIGLIISVNRHEPLELAEEMVALAVDHLGNGVIGVDLCGNEASFSAVPFLNLFKEARKSGLRIGVHAGEWGGPENVREAIELFDADRIGHGIRVMDDPYVIDLAREHGTVFEVCVTSNYQSGVVPALASHPLSRMLTAGLNATINTDDPSISRITLADEYWLVCEKLGIPLDILKERILSAAQVSFLPADEKVSLVSSLQQELDLAIA